MDAAPTPDLPQAPATPVVPSSQQEGVQEPEHEAITQPAKLLRIASMVRELLEETRQASLDEPGRMPAPSKSTSERSASSSDVLSPDLQEELSSLAPPMQGVPTDAEIRVAQAQLVGWLEGLFHGIQAAMFSQQTAARAQFEELRAAGSLAERRRPAGPGPDAARRPVPLATRQTSAASDLRRRSRSRPTAGQPLGEVHGDELTSMTTSATTFTIGRFRGRRMLLKMNFGSVSCGPGGEVRHDDLVERQRERQQRPGHERGADRREGD